MLHERFLFGAEIGHAQFRPQSLVFELVNARINGDAGNPMLERDLARKLVKLPEDLNEDSLDQILLTRAIRQVSPYAFNYGRV
jgi:hypothetical protein